MYEHNSITVHFEPTLRYSPTTTRFPHPTQKNNNNNNKTNITEDDLNDEKDPGGLTTEDI